MTAGEPGRADVDIDEKARDGLADLRERHAGCQAEVTTKLDTLLKNQERALDAWEGTSNKLDKLCDKVDDHDFWIKASKRFMAAVLGIGTMLTGAWAKVKLGL